MLGASLAVGAGLLLTPAAQAQLQPSQTPQQGQDTQTPHGAPSAQGGQASTPDLQQIWQMQRMQMRARIAGAVQQLRTACGEELRNFCGTVTPGEGRLLLCMQAHEDKISPQCELSLLEVTRNIGKAASRVESFAQACWGDIQAHCTGTGGSVLRCMAEKRGMLSGPCQAQVTAMIGPVQTGTPQAGKMPPAQATMIGVPIYSADGIALGQVTGLKRRGDGSLEAIEADIGSPLGLGGTSVLINPGELRWRGDGIELQMMAEQVRAVLQGQGQGQGPGQGQGQSPDQGQGQSPGPGQGPGQPKQ
jgi:hypothetical protein